MIDLHVYHGIDGASIRPLSVTQGGTDSPFISTRLYADGACVSFLLSVPDSALFAARLREIADAIDSGRAVDIDKGYYADGTYHRLED